MESGDMGDLKENLDELFITDDQGRRLFFPFGAFGKARLLRDEEEEAHERECHERARLHSEWVVGLSLGGAVFIESWVGKAVFVVVTMTSFLAWQIYRLRKLPIVDGPRLSIMGAWRSRARANSYLSLISCAVGSLMLVIGGCWLLTQPERANFWMALGTVVVCSFTLVMLCIGIWMKAHRDL